MKKFIFILLVASSSVFVINAANKQKPTKTLSKPAANNTKGTCTMSAFKSKDGTKAYFVTTCNIK